VNGVAASGAVVAELTVCALPEIETDPAEVAPPRGVVTFTASGF
jgi:hypothetical protein